jgi:hypothetical protein
MRISKPFVGLSILAGILVAVASLLGISDPRTYGKETLNWAEQAVGQDWVNLCVVFPELSCAEGALACGGMTPLSPIDTRPASHSLR